MPYEKAFGSAIPKALVAEFDRIVAEKRGSWKRKRAIAAAALAFVQAHQKGKTDELMDEVNRYYPEPEIIRPISDEEQIASEMNQGVNDQKDREKVRGRRKRKDGAA